MLWNVLNRSSFEECQISFYMLDQCDRNLYSALLEYLRNKSILCDVVGEGYQYTVYFKQPKNISFTVKYNRKDND